MTDRIELHGITAFGYHGVLPSERATGQDFIVDVTMHVDTRLGAAADDLDLTVSYADVATRVAAVITGDPADLIETVAERIAAVVMEFGVDAVDVAVHKPSAPIDVEFADVVVRIHRDQENSPVVDPPRFVDVRQPVSAAVPVAESDEELDSEFEAEAEVEGAAEVDLDEADDETPDEPDEADDDGTVLSGAVGVMAGAVAPTIGLPTGGTTVMGPEAIASATAFDEAADRAPSAPVVAVIALGANLGEATATLRTAVGRIGEIAQTTVLGVSPLARTAPVGGPPDQPDYLNAVVKVETSLSPRALLKELQRLEDEAGRVRVERWGARTLDLDLITYGDQVIKDAEVTVPHPRAHERAFVLEPWLHLDPGAEIPGHGRISRLVDAAHDTGKVKWMALGWMGDPS